MSDKPYWLGKPSPTSIRQVRADADDVLRRVRDAKANFNVAEGRGMSYDEIIEARDPLFEADEFAQRLYENVARLEAWVIDNLPAAGPPSGP